MIYVDGEAELAPTAETDENGVDVAPLPSMDETVEVMKLITKVLSEYVQRHKGIIPIRNEHQYLTQQFEEMVEQMDPMERKHVFTDVMTKDTMLDDYDVWEAEYDARDALAAETGYNPPAVPKPKPMPRRPKPPAVAKPSSMPPPPKPRLKRKKTFFKTRYTPRKDSLFLI